MSEPRKPIPVEELGEARWERIERRLLEARERERVAGPERAHGRGGRLLSFALAGAVAVAASVIVTTVMRPAAPPPASAQPTRVVTPPGGSSRVVIGDAEVRIGADSEVVIEQQGSRIQVGLAKGLVDCEVAPRQGRPPFLVVAGDVTVTVVGTRFQVEKREAVRVSVTHGKVNVESSSGRRQVATGESWASGELVVAAQPAPEAAPEPPPAVAASPSPSPAPALPEPDLSVEKKLLRKAEAMDRSDPKEAMRIYVSLVQARDKAVAARSIYSLALLEFNARHYEEAVRWSERYLDKHPHGRNADDVFQVRVESYFALEYNQRARDVAREYLQRFPASRYAERARRIANW